MWILWTLVIGFVAGVLAKFVTPGDQHEPQGFILTTLSGIAGAFVMTFLGASSRRRGKRLELCWPLFVSPRQGQGLR